MFAEAGNPFGAMGYDRKRFIFKWERDIIPVSVAGRRIPAPGSMFRYRLAYSDLSHRTRGNCLRLRGNGCGMLLRLLVVPFTVSFRNLKIQEVPADLGNWQQWGSHDGYFSDYAFYQYWCHSTFWGAGVWRSVDEFCSLGFDESRMLNWPQPWSEGHLSWKIPYGWKHKDSTSSVCVGQIEPPTYSTWTMRTNFIEKVKHDRRIGVSLSGQMFFEGVLQNGNQ